MHRYENKTNGATTAEMDTGVEAPNNHAMMAIASHETWYTIKIMRKTNKGLEFLDPPKMTCMVIYLLFKRKIHNCMPD